MELTIPTWCPRCNKPGEVRVDADAHRQWQEGTLIQNAFPNMSADDREQLISGMCPKCWDELFN